MGVWRAVFLAGGALLGASALAQAADLPPAPPIEPAPAAVEYSGWYLRGAVGVAIPTGNTSVSISPNPLIGLPADAFNSFYNPTVSASGIFSAGVGYQFNNWLRFDVTGEYHGGSQFQVLEQLAIPSATTQFADFYRGNVSRFVLMANGYADIGTWYGVTPYIGAGVGWSQNYLDGVTDTGFAYVGPGATGSPTGGYFNNSSTSNFAWALMAGLDFNVTQNLKLELGYRYLNTGPLKTGTSNCFNGTGANGGFSVANCGGSGYYLKTGNQAESDLMLGLIWLFEAPPAPAPIVTRY
jgi:opacity protein-like surface antigen